MDGLCSEELKEAGPDQEYASVPVPPAALPVSVSVLPEQIAPPVPIAVTDGDGLTVTPVVAVLVQPAPFVPVTV